MLQKELQDNTEEQRNKIFILEHKIEELKEEIKDLTHYKSDFYKKLDSLDVIYNKVSSILGFCNILFYSIIITVLLKACNIV